MSLVISILSAMVIGSLLAYLCVKYGNHIVENSSNISYSLDEYNFKKGKAFLFFGSLNQIAPESTTMFTICVGDDDVAISEIRIQSTSKFISWNWFHDVEVTPETGTSIYEVQRNSNINSTSNCKIIIDPECTSSGQLFSVNVDIHGVAVSDDASHIRESIINKPYALKKNTNHGFSIKNRDSKSRNIEVIFEMYKM